MLWIRVVSRAGETLLSPLEARFGEAGGDIGRGADCTLVLPDSERRISRKHLQVEFRNGRHLLRLVSTNMLVTLNGVPLAPGTDYPLAAGAEIRMGPFVLQAHAEAPVAEPAPSDVPIDVVLGQTTAAAPLRPATEDLFDALYAGLGVVPAAVRAPQQARLLGALLRAAIAGTLGLLATRTIAKRELGADRTMPRAHENNPLKFTTDVDTALAHLLGPPQRGFIAPLAAVDAAFADLRAHELALLAGTRAALEAVLARFDPQALEARFAGKAVWENLVPVNHKARLWERYAEQHAALVREVEDDFDALFGDAFLEAYRGQLARMGRPPSA